MPNGLRLSGARKGVRCSRGLGGMGQHEPDAAWFSVTPLERRIVLMTFCVPHHVVIVYVDVPVRVRHDPTYFREEFAPVLYAAPRGVGGVVGKTCGSLEYNSEFRRICGIVYAERFPIITNAGLQVALDFGLDRVSWNHTFDRPKLLRC